MLDLVNLAWRINRKDTSREREGESHRGIGEEREMERNYWCCRKSVCGCTHMIVCVFVCAHVCVCVCVCAHVCVCVCVCVCVQAYVCTHVSVGVCFCACVSDSTCETQRHTIHTLVCIFYICRLQAFWKDTRENWWVIRQATPVISSSSDFFLYLFTSIIIYIMYNFGLLTELIICGCELLLFNSEKCIQLYVLWPHI